MLRTINKACTIPKMLVLKLIILLIFIPILNGCAKQSEKVVLNISAASSLKDVFAQTKPLFEKAYPGITLRYNFASSGTLEQQVEQGAPTDVFISAGKKQIDGLMEKNLIKGWQSLTENSLVIIIPKGNPTKFKVLKDLNNPVFKKIAIGYPETVPAGKYAQEALENAGIWQDVVSHMVFAKDVKQVAFYVASGNVDAGIVYRSDLYKTKNLTKVYDIPAKMHSKIIYPATILQNTVHPDEAKKFLEFMLSKQGQEIFKAQGFVAIK